MTLQLDVRDFSLNISPASIWRRALVFGDIVLDAPFVNATVAADGSVNLTQLRPKSAPAAPPPPDKTNQLRYAWKWPKQKLA